MNKLSKSAVVLIVLAVAAIALGAVLFFTMPLTDSFSHEKWMENGTAHHFMYDGETGRSGYSGRASHMGGGFSLPFLLIFAAILFFIFRGRRHGHFGRRNHSRTILDQMYAEEKISLEEYRRKRTIIEEEN